MEKRRAEDYMLADAVEKYTLSVFREYEPYEKCMCLSGKKFRFCCQKLKRKSKAWKMTYNIINDLLTKKRLKHKISKFESTK